MRPFLLIIVSVLLTLSPLTASVSALAMCQPGAEPASSPSCPEPRAFRALPTPTIALPAPDVPRPDLAAPIVPQHLELRGGEVSHGCLLPGSVDCSIAIAASASICEKIALWTVCINAWFGAIGGGSSVAVQGGGAVGQIDGTLASCDWSGASGDCLSLAYGIGKCGATAASTGSLTVVDSALLVVAPSGPTVVATAGCSVVEAESVAAWRATLVEELRAHAAAPESAPISAMLLHAAAGLDG